MNAITQSILSSGRARTLQELVPLFKEIRISRGINQRALDQASGLADGYCGKLEAGTRGVGVDSINALLAALGLELALVERVIPKQVGASKLLAIAGNSSDPIENQKIFRRRRAMRGGLERGSRLTARQRYEIAKKAGKASGDARKKRAMIKSAVMKRKARVQAKINNGEQGNG